MNKIFVHHRSPHHAQNSGYGKLVDNIKGHVIYGDTKFPYFLAKLLACRYSQNGGIYNSSSILKSIELFLLLKKLKNEQNIVHFLNGERDIRHLGFLKKRFPNTFFCATFHKPPEILKNTITNTRSLKKLDGAIAVGANQVAYLKEWLELDKVEYIPHGVDTDFFKPDPNMKKSNTLLFVGQHLRDFKTLNSSIPRLSECISDLKINVVVHPGYVSEIIQHPNVEIFTKIDDKTLLKFYQRATALYLPMLDSTACNSLLEALACGLPIITTNVGGNKVYLEGAGSIIIEKENGKKLIEVTKCLLENTTLLKSKSVLSRKKGLELSWIKVAKQVEVFYQNLI